MTHASASSGVLPNSTWRAISQLQPRRLVHLDVPGLVEQRADLVPQQQVVALGDDERDLGRHRDRAGDRLLDLAPERGRVDGLVRRPQPPQQRGVAGTSNVCGAPMRSRMPWRTSSAWARWKPSIGTSTAASPRLRHERGGERRLAAAGRARDAEDRALAAAGQRAGAGGQALELARSRRVWSRLEAHLGRHPRRAGLICAAAVVDVTLLGGTGAPTHGPRDCLTIQERRTSCDRSDAWYRPTKEKPTSDGCSKGRRRSEDGEALPASPCIRSRSICRASLRAPCAPS